jgi:NADPH-dependent 2,4-dienoyl-CoA reductase/sulfur reductase-like enzyme/nitrite reductase/ring-hydroxylating ferredoxin subunit
MKEKVVAKEDELSDGQMKAVEVDGDKILLSRVKGKYYATTAECPHYGAPLENGVLNGSRLVCPWHHASFDVQTGELQEPPARDHLFHFETRVEGGNVIVKIPEDHPSSRVPDMTKHDPDKDERRYVILGAGAAGNAAAQTLRESGFEGRVIMITEDDRMPYDRPNLSKEYLQGKAEDEWMPLRSKDFYEQYDIEVMLDQEVRGVDSEAKRIALESGQNLGYDRLLLATGGRPRSLDVPGSDLKNVFTLRSMDDSDAIIKATAKASKVAVIGASFIGMETAFSLSERGLDVTVIAPESVPLERVFGKEVGTMFRRLHEKNGVTFQLDRKVVRFEGKESVESLLLDDGEDVHADLVVIGIGVDPATDVLQGVKVQSDGSIVVDKYLQADEDVYAAGDIAAFPDWRTGERIRIEHWRTAEQQGRIAGKNMAGDRVAYESVPFFWTAQAGLHFRYVGHAREWDEVIIKGDIAEGDFLAFYVKDDRVLAVAGNNRDRELAAIEELIRTGRMPGPNDIRSGEIDFVKVLTGE